MTARPAPQDPWKVLGVEPGASPQEIRGARGQSPAALPNGPPPVATGRSRNSSRSRFCSIPAARRSRAQEIKRAYRRKALKEHPDVNKAPEAKEPDGPSPECKGGWTGGGLRFVVEACASCVRCSLLGRPVLSFRRMLSSRLGTKTPSLSLSL